MYPNSIYGNRIHKIRIIDRAYDEYQIKYPRIYKQCLALVDELINHNDIIQIAITAGLCMEIDSYDRESLSALCDIVNKFKRLEYYQIRRRLHDLYTLDLYPRG